MVRTDRQLFRCLPVSRESFWAPGQPDERRTALREAAYIRRTKFCRGKLLHDFACRGEDLFMLTPIIPTGAPDWVNRPFLRWRNADEAAKGQAGDGSIAAWHICADLPPRMSRGQWLDGVELLLRDVLPPEVVAEFVGHVPEDDPPHAHILVAARRAERWRYGRLIEGLPSILSGNLKDRWLEWLGVTAVGRTTDLRRAA